MKFKLRNELNPRCYNNKLGIVDDFELEKVEQRLVGSRKQELLDGSHIIDMTYDISMLQNIHSYLFSDLYDWAGYIRSESDEVMSYKSVFFTKDLTIYSLSTQTNISSIREELEKVFDDIKRDDFLNGADLNEMAYKSSEYFSRFNKIHPFFEGNGRVQKLVISDILFQNDCILDMSKIDVNKIYEANMAGLRGDYKPLADLYRGCIKDVNAVRSNYNRLCDEVKKSGNSPVDCLGERSSESFER